MILSTTIFSCTSFNKKDFRKERNTKEILQETVNFFSDSLLNGNRDIMKIYLEKYHSDTCGNHDYTNIELKENFTGVRAIKSIRHKDEQDFVFVVPPLNNCDGGESYFFLDSSLPRLLTDSFCCHSDNLFVIEDIDEDGVNEIGIYYSTCVSRYKSLRIYSLKQNYWEEIATSTFDIQTQDTTEVKFDELVKKITKNKFEICNFEDGEITWQTITMK